MHPVLDLSDAEPAAQPSASAATGQDPQPSRLRAQLAKIWHVVRITFTICMKYRITGLAAEAAFFALLSLPPLALGLVGTLGYLDGVIGVQRIEQIKQNILDGSSTILSPHGVDTIVRPTLDTVLKTGRPDLISIGFVLALWSGSRAMNVYVDTITIAYGLSGRRGIVRTRLLAFGLYLIGLALGAVAVPLLVIGPNMLIAWHPGATGIVHVLYWPVVLLALVAFLNTLYHVAVPVRTPWSQDLPGTVLAVLLWIGGSVLTRHYISSTIDGSSTSTSLYGGLAAPVAVLLWLYVTALAVLLGAALNAAVEQVWPSRTLWLARLALRQRVAAQRTLPLPCDAGADDALD